MLVLSVLTEVLVHFLMEKKKGFRKVKELVQNFTGSKWQSMV
jgi:hypothetical protein